MKVVLLFALMFVLSGISMAGYGIVATIDAPDTNISGLGYGNGSLWAVDGVTEYAYQVNPADGAIQNSWYCENTSRIPSGLTFANNRVYIAMGTPPNLTLSYCYRYSAAGAYEAMFSLDC